MDRQAREEQDGLARDDGEEINVLLVVGGDGTNGSARSVVSMDERGPLLLHHIILLLYSIYTFCNICLN